MRGTRNVAVRDGWADVALLELAPLLDRRDLEWQDAALCAQTDPESFFPEKGGSTLEPKRTCRACAVRAECLGYALDREERFGVWGGLSERERRRLKARFGDDTSAAVASVTGPASIPQPQRTAA